MPSNRKSLIKFNKQKIANLVKRAFKETTTQYFEECQRVISDSNAFPEFPNQDIIDTGTLKASGKVFQSDGKFEAVWTAPYAIYVHEGYTLRNGKQQKGRPWTEKARETINLEQAIGEKLAKILK